MSVSPQGEASAHWEDRPAFRIRRSISGTALQGEPHVQTDPELGKSGDRPPWQARAPQHATAPQDRRGPLNTTAPLDMTTAPRDRQEPLDMMTAPPGQAGASQHDSLPGTGGGPLTRRRPQSQAGMGTLAESVMLSQ